jgi:hypothetical protein
LRYPGVNIKMKLRSSRFSAPIAVAACLLSACASVPPTGVEGKVTEVKLYASGQLAASQYEVVRHIWVDSWRADFSVPTYPSEAVGIAALRVEAARLGADGLINVTCLDQGHPQWWSSTEATVLCYGNAIRLRRNEGQPAATPTGT